MGNSKSKQSLTLEQQDIKCLGDRFPFGDDELVRLYRCYQGIIESEENESFLVDIAVHNAVLPLREEDLDGVKLKELQKHRSMAVKICETNILPEGFSERLECAAFARLREFKQVVDEPDEYTRLARLEKFFDGMSNGGRRGGRKALGTFFQCFSEGDDHPTDSSHLVHHDGNEIKAKASMVLDAAYRLSLATAFLRCAFLQNVDEMENFIPDSDGVKKDEKFMESLCQSVLEHVKRKKMRESRYGDISNDDEIDLEQGIVCKFDFIEWSESNAPLLSSILPTFLHQVVFPDLPYPPSRTPFTFPVIEVESAFFNDPASPMLFSFAAMSSALGGRFFRLYTSTCDGLSFNRLQNSLLGYGGPTLIVIQATNGGIFGAFTASSWKESKDFYGNSDCFLYQLLPTRAVYRPRGGGTNYMYCNSEARSRGYDGLSHGIGFGGTSEMPRLFIAESFDGCVASAQDLTFEPGPLLPRNKHGSFQTTFEIDNLEVWGVGGDVVVANALESRDQARELKAANIRKARKVDKAQFLDDFRSGIIESKAFKHREEIQGRADEEVDARHKNSYGYEK